MKKLIILTAVLSLLFGCKASKTIEFCEGVSAEGKGVNCGEQFLSGELTAVITIETPFNVNRLNVNIFKKAKYKLEKVGSQTIDVKPDDTSTRTTFYFYDEGEFIVEVIGQDDKKIAEGSIKIIDI
ncbi:MAG: hypothetical protein JXN64_07975 [Spirochaetes bacterium]|nr:hypothetical protein [Spirochaetota bacterium]